MHITTAGKRHPYTLVLTVGTLAAATAVAAGVAWAGQDDNERASAPHGFTSAREVGKQYASELPNFEAPFPTGVPLPDMNRRLTNLESLAAEASANRDSNRSVTFEDGFAQAQMAVVWTCAWEQAYVNGTTAGDERGVAKAAAMLNKRDALKSVHKYIEDPEHAWFRDVVVPALRGDISAMVDDLNNNCGAPFGHPEAR